MHAPVSAADQMPRNEYGSLAIGGQSSRRGFDDGSEAAVCYGAGGVLTHPIC